VLIVLVDLVLVLRERVGGWCVAYDKRENNLNVTVMNILCGDVGARLVRRGEMADGLLVAAGPPGQAELSS
jgi:hypothetical protein